MNVWVLKFEGNGSNEVINVYADRADAAADFMTEADARFSRSTRKYAKVTEGADGALTLCDGYVSLELVPMPLKGRLPAAAIAAAE
ncbi:hypothetical protein [Actinomadura opuntiae]|uniref:hypothetical protein n=1 Tax=Actinomadura sp. OS1-43 TaxID=604315 RepID=UPI00255A9ECB|nr:hypothetical protein [Actinomadura sp. OS1-43]MDL4812795.1 hypothetical protein [Actinomadura sp. OS1-43]